jgi:aminopeptidase N
LNGKKITILGSGTATEWRHIAMGVGFTTGVESECIAKGPEGSDQVSFHRIGVPAVQIFTGLHEDYHRPTDDVEKIDVGGLVKVATFVRESVVYLSERERPLTSTLGAGTKTPKGPSTGRRVSLGTMPDFAFQGPGVRVTGVTSDSPAAKAGIQKGDVLLSLGGKPMKDLRSFSQLLGAHAPGDEVDIVLRRGDKQLTLRAKLVAR